MRLTILVLTAAFTSVQSMSAQNSTTSRLALADSLLTAMDFDHSIARTAPPTLPPSVSGEAKSGMAGYQAFAKKFLSPEVLRPRMAEVYADRFTEDELRDLTRFYQTPIGKKLVSLQPELAKANQDIVFQILQEHMSDYVQLMAQPPG